MVKPALTFLGAAGTVTGSKYLLDTGTGQFLIDCGTFQGLSDLRRRNWTPPAVNPRELTKDALTLRTIRS